MANFHGPAPLRPMMDLRKMTPIVVVGLIAALCVGVTYFVMSPRNSPSPKNVPDPISAPVTKEELFKGLPKGYEDIKKPVVAQLPPQGTALPPQQTNLPPVPTPVPITPPEKTASVPPPTQNGRTFSQTGTGTPPNQTTPPSVTVKPERPAPKKWQVTQPTTVTVKHDGQAQETTINPLGAQALTKESQAQSLILPAIQAQPLDPRKVLYWDQTVPGILIDNINSDSPGQIVIMVTRDVFDRFQSGNVLIPQFARVRARPEGQIKYGQTRLDMTLDQMLFPDGRVVALIPTKLGGSAGATGLGSEDGVQVNNHYGKLLLGVGIQAVLNIGARSIAGEPSGFQPSIGQETAREVGQGINQAARPIVQQFQVPPTIFADAAKVNKAGGVTFHVKENMSFMTQPVIVTK